MGIVIDMTCADDGPVTQIARDFLVGIVSHKPLTAVSLEREKINHNYARRCFAPILGVLSQSWGNYGERK